MMRGSGLLILTGLLSLAMAGLLALSHSFAAAIAGFIGLGLLVFGTGRMQRNRRDLPAPAPETVEPRHETIFSVLSSGDGAIIERIGQLLERDPRVTAIIAEKRCADFSEENEEAPGWTVLRVYLGFEDVGAALDRITMLIRESLGPDALNRITIQPHLGLVR